MRPVVLAVAALLAPAVLLPLAESPEVVPPGSQVERPADIESGLAVLRLRMETAEGMVGYGSCVPIACELDGGAFRVRLLTARHCLEGPVGSEGIVRLTVEMFAAPDFFIPKWSADVVSSTRDERADIALLEVSMVGPVRVVEVGSRPAQSGDEVLLAGYPHGDELHLARGIMSSCRPAPPTTGDVWWHVGTPVMHGMSGGAMIDERGELVGIIVARTLGDEGIGYVVGLGGVLRFLESAGAVPSSRAVPGGR